MQTESKNNKKYSLQNSGFRCAEFKPHYYSVLLCLSGRLLFFGWSKKFFEHIPRHFIMRHRLSFSCHPLEHVYCHVRTMQASLKLFVKEIKEKCNCMYSLEVCIVLTDSIHVVLFHSVPWKWPRCFQFLFFKKKKDSQMSFQWQKLCNPRLFQWLFPYTVL